MAGQTGGLCRHGDSPCICAGGRADFLYKRKFSLKEHSRGFVIVNKKRRIFSHGNWKK